jgi:hypothetical protein
MGSQLMSLDFPTVSSVPVMSREKFAEVIGLPPGVVVGWANKGLIPTLNVGKYSLVNVALLQKQALEKEFE